MTPDQAARSLAPLIAGTNGWNDAAITLYIEELSQLDDVEALAHTCRQIVRDWTDGWRPPLGTVLEVYKSFVRRDRMALPAATPGETATLTVGRKIAAQAYAAECESQGREPSWRFFNSNIGTSTKDAA
jgi:hypothetical protein